VNGEHYAVMAGAGFDARMIKDASRGMKSRIGRAAYIYAGARNLRARRVKAAIDVDGRRFFTGRISCVLVGNVSRILGGIEAFRGARPDDGRLELGVVTAKNPVEWARTLGRLALGTPEKSPFVKVTSGAKFRVRFGREVPYELDGGARPAVRKMRIKARPSSITVCVPAAAELPVHPALPVAYRPVRGRTRAAGAGLLGPAAFGLIRSVVAVSHKTENTRLPRMSVGWCSPRYMREIATRTGMAIAGIRNSHRHQPRAWPMTRIASAT